VRSQSKARLLATTIRLFERSSATILVTLISAPSSPGVANCPAGLGAAGAPPATGMPPARRPPPPTCCTGTMSASRAAISVADMFLIFTIHSDSLAKAEGVSNSLMISTIRSTFSAVSVMISDER
jgi:hypothetical protein